MGGEGLLIKEEEKKTEISVTGPLKNVEKNWKNMWMKNTWQTNVPNHSKISYDGVGPSPL